MLPINAASDSQSAKSCILNPYIAPLLHEYVESIKISDAVWVGLALRPTEHSALCRPSETQTSMAKRSASGGPFAARSEQFPFEFVRDRQECYVVIVACHVAV